MKSTSLIHLIFSIILFLLNGCRPPDDLSPQPVSYSLIDKLDFPIELRAKSFQLSVGDTIWVETSFSEQDLLSKLKGNSSINELNANFSFNIINWSKPGIFMQNQCFETIVDHGTIIYKRENAGQLNHFMWFENGGKNYKIKIGFLMKQEGVFGFNLNAFSSTQVANNYTDNFAGGGQINFTDNQKTFFGNLNFVWQDKTANETFFKQLNIKTEANFSLEQHYFFKVGK